MNKETCMKEAEESILHTYNRFPVVFDHGEGVYLYDTDGKEYLDFAAGIAVQAFGYHNREYSEALKTQVDKLMHTSNLFYNEPITSAAKRVLKASRMDRVFFTNSGTEAIEGALKAAKKYAYTRDGHAGHEIIAMNHSFHGRSLGALSVTGNKHYQEPFEPLLPGIRFAEFNQLDSVKALINEKTCAIILETVQGEGGIYPATDEFLQGVRALCDEHDILLILDEIQCGMGRTGEMFAWQHYGVKPDIMTSAKALDTVLKMMERDQITEHVKEITPYLEQKLDALVEKYDFLTARRGLGLMQGVVCEKPVGKIASAALEHGLVVITAGADVLRFVPPLIIGKEHVDEMAEKLDAVLAEM